jgi:hypothetical protein
MISEYGTFIYVPAMLLILLVGRSCLLPKGLELSRAALLSRVMLLLGLLTAASLLSPAAPWQYAATLFFLIAAAVAELVSRVQRTRTE